MKTDVSGKAATWGPWRCPSDCQDYEDLDSWCHGCREIARLRGELETTGRNTEVQIVAYIREEAAEFRRRKGFDIEAMRLTELAISIEDGDYRKRRMTMDNLGPCDCGECLFCENDRLRGALETSEREFQRHVSDVVTVAHSQTCTCNHTRRCPACRMYEMLRTAEVWVPGDYLPERGEDFPRGYLVGLGLLSSDLMVMADGDGFTLEPERHRWCYRLTDKGRGALARVRERMGRHG